jgi:hypothetical protein
MKIPMIALMLALASLAGLALTIPAGAGSCSHCVFDDDASTPPAPKRS